MNAAEVVYKKVEENMIQISDDVIFYIKDICF